MKESPRKAKHKSGRVLPRPPARRIRGKLIVFLLFVSARILLRAEEPNESAGLDFAGAGRLAVSSSEELRNEYRRHYLREGAWTWALRSYFPQLSFSVSEDDRLSTTGNDSFVKNYSIGAEQLLWDGGRISTSRKIERIELAMNLIALERTASGISENAIGFFRRVLFCRKLKDIREDALQSLEEQRLILRREIELGLATSLDLTGADLAAAGAEIELLSCKLDLEEAETKLCEILGVKTLPLLVEEVDVEKIFPAVDTDTARFLAEAGNPELKAARLAVTRRQIEAKAASVSWLPILKLTGNFAVSGRRYPLNRYNWSLGFILEFSSPWISGKLNGQAGREPPHDKNAKFQTGVSPLQNPAEIFSARNAALALEIEKANYDLTFRRAGLLAEQALEKYGLAEKRKSLAADALALEGEKYRLAELRLELGRLTRVELMEARLEYAAKEAALLEAAMALLEAGRELEKIMNLNPGELALISGPRAAAKPLF